MKTSLFSLVIILIAISVNSQTNPLTKTDCRGNYGMNFEQNFCNDHIIIDTTSNPNNIWQVGPPQKAVLDSAASAPNVIITDTINPYPTNDTSSFIIQNIAEFGFDFSALVILEGWYWVNSDSLNDYGTIEFSPDNGNTWIDLLQDSFFNANNLWVSSKPNLTGNSNGWQFFGTEQLGFLSNARGDLVVLGDTVLYKFTFISDSIPDTLDGLMFDNLHFEDWVEGVEEIGFNAIYSRAFPNPSNSNITIEFENLETANFQFVVYDNLGRVVIENQVRDNRYYINADALDVGIYHYKLISSQTEKRSAGKFIISP